MTRAQAIAIFGKTQADLAAAILGPNGKPLTQGAISQWPLILTDRQEDLVRGAARRHNKRIRL